MGLGPCKLGKLATFREFGNIKMTYQVPYIAFMACVFNFSILFHTVNVASNFYKTIECTSLI